MREPASAPGGRGVWLGGLVLAICIHVCVCKDFIWARVASHMQHISSALGSKRFCSHSSLLQVWSLSMLQTMQSLMRLSASGPNSHDLALSLRSGM